MIKNKGITFLELIIATSLITLVLCLGIGMGLTVRNMYKDALSNAQKQINAMVPMMHMMKHLQQAAKFEMVTSLVAAEEEEPFLPLLSTLVQFYTYTDPPDFAAGPTIIRQYSYDPTNHQIIYTPNVFSPADTQIIGTHIYDPTDSIITHDSPLDGTVVNIRITARDNNDSAENEYVLESTAEARYASVPTVY